jgi:hypothetical protein
MKINEACKFLAEGIGPWVHGLTPYFKRRFFKRPHWKGKVGLESGESGSMVFFWSDGEHQYGRFQPGLFDCIAEDYEVEDV